MKTFHSYAELRACAGQEVAVTDWVTITQAQVNLFADATGDHQWIHVDPVKAAQGPFGGPIAHGFLSLSLLPLFFEKAVRIQGAMMGVNYGLNKVRFPAPVPVGSRVRARVGVQAVEPVGPDSVQISWLVTVEREGGDKPVCVAESLSRSYGAAMGDW
ncbi:MaoC family dehydratase [Comamonas jiangduensis]|uniref:MaoC family dehydratase n=1 Tax=Comamonas jiangduensis TaxID=1194168 RepID=A0ABV4IEK0_9BURK